MGEEKKGLRRYLWMTEETLPSIHQQSKEPPQEPTKKADFDYRVDKYILEK
jgi:hypothetical protein